MAGTRQVLAKPRRCSHATKILLATDGSSHAEEALKYARDLALRDGAQVIVVHAFAPVPSYLGKPWGIRPSGVMWPKETESQDSQRNNCERLA